MFSFLRMLASRGPLKLATKLAYMTEVSVTKRYQPATSGMDPKMKEFAKEMEKKQYL
jgi:hypothetical protein